MKKAQRSRNRPRKRQPSAPSLNRVPGAQVVVVNPSRSIVPPFMQTTIIYSDYFNWASGATTGVVYPFRNNSCRDPYAGIGGGSPSGFVQLSALYTRYRVLSVRFELWGYNTCDSPLIIGIFNRPSYGAILVSGTEIQQMMERPYQFVFQTVNPFIPGIPHPKYRIDLTRSPDQIEGRALMGEEDYKCTFNSEPNLQTYMDVCMTAGNGNTQNITANGYVRIHYRIECYEPAQVYTD